MDQHIQSYEELVTQAADEKIKEHIPAYALKKCQEMLCLVKQHMSEITLAIATETGDFKVLCNNMKASSANAKKSHDSLKNFFEEALAHVGGT